MALPYTSALVQFALKAIYLVPAMQGDNNFGNNGHIVVKLI
jgi:hypothetical protein